MSIGEIETGLADRFELLAGGRRGKLRRQQTIRAAIEWSIELLEPGERDVLARLAVFPGAFSMTGAAAVGGLSPTVTVRVLSSLTAKSLVQRGGDVAGEARFFLLETIREWGFEDLVRRDLLAGVRDAHAEWHLSVAEAMTATEFMLSGNFRHDDAIAIDVAAAAAHLRERDIEGAALLVCTHAWVFVETGSGPWAREIVEESFAHGWTRFPSRQFFGRGWLAAALLDSFFDFPPPPDDGSFEWRFLVGGKDHENAGILGLKRVAVSPQRVIDDARALPPVGPGSEAQLLRAIGLANAAEAFTVLGYFEEAITTFEESRRFYALAKTIPASTRSDVASLAIAGLCLGADLRDTAAAHEVRRGEVMSVHDRFVESIVLSAPQDRFLAVASAARDHSRGRWPAEESLFLAALGFFALAEGDNEGARFLSESIEIRSWATLALKRHNVIRAQGQPLDLIADQQHHRQALLATSSQGDVRELNRTKLRNELDRIFAGTNPSGGSVA